MLRFENSKILRILGDGGGYCILEYTLLPSDDEIYILRQIFDQAFEAYELLRCDDTFDRQTGV